MSTCSIWIWLLAFLAGTSTHAHQDTHRYVILSPQPCLHSHLSYRTDIVEHMFWQWVHCFLSLVFPDLFKDVQSDRCFGTQWKLFCDPCESFFLNLRYWFSHSKCCLGVNLTKHWLMQFLIVDAVVPSSFNMCKFNKRQTTTAISQRLVLIPPHYL